MPGPSPGHFEFQYECYKMLILQGNFELLLTVRHRGILTKTKKAKDTWKKNNIMEKQTRQKKPPKTTNALIACYNELNFSIHTCELRYFRFCSKISCPILSCLFYPCVAYEFALSAGLAHVLLPLKAKTNYATSLADLPLQQQHTNADPSYIQNKNSNNTQTLICQTYPQVNAMLICFKSQQYAVWSHMNPYTNQ